MARRDVPRDAARRSSGAFQPPPAPVGLDLYEATSLALAHELQHQANLAAMREYEDHLLALEYAQDPNLAPSPAGPSSPQGTLLQELQAMQSHQDRLLALEYGREHHLDRPPLRAPRPASPPAVFVREDQDFDMDVDDEYQNYAQAAPPPPPLIPNHALHDVDPDNMTYEQLLQLGEQVGDVKKERWRQVSAAVISSLPTHRWTTPSRGDVSCVICQCGYAHGDVSLTLACAHVFHGECLSRWARDNNSCPICKLEIAKI